jgi:hypothetical protein
MPAGEVTLQGQRDTMITSLAGTMRIARKPSELHCLQTKPSPHVEELISPLGSCSISRDDPSR